LLVSNIIHAQVTANSSGYVGLATSIQSGYKVTMGDNIYIYHGSYPGFIINGSGSNCNSGLTLYPSTNNAGNLGKASNAFTHIYCNYGSVETSDARQKENVRNLESPLELILKLQGVKYDVKKEFAYTDSLVKDEKTKEKFEKERKNQIGFLAQDVNNVIPEVVVYDDSADVYGILYSRLVPYLVEAIKEQQTTIESLKSEIASIKNNSTEKSATISGSNVTNTTETASLEQNIPNPFNTSTTIKMYLPSAISRATLYIYTMQGAQIKSYAIADRGNTTVTIEGSGLNAGMYLYTLIADGKEVDTKKMILTK